MVLNVNVLGEIVKYWILKDPNATLIITVEYSGLQDIINQPCLQPVNPNGLTTSS